MAKRNISLNENDLRRLIRKTLCEYYHDEDGDYVPDELDYADAADDAAYDAYARDNGFKDMDQWWDYNSYQDQSAKERADQEDQDSYNDFQDNRNKDLAGTGYDPSIPNESRYRRGVSNRMLESITRRVVRKILRK